MRVGRCDEKVEERSPKTGRRSLTWLRGTPVMQEKLGGVVMVSGASVGEGCYSCENLYPQNLNLRYFWYLAVSSGAS
jgi:hypothetical protein